MRFLVTEMVLQQINFIQINLQHCPAATTVLCRHLDKMQNTAAIIQEPWIVKSRIVGLNNLNGTVVSLYALHLIFSFYHLIFICFHLVLEFFSWVDDYIFLLIYLLL